MGVRGEVRGGEGKGLVLLYTPRVLAHVCVIETSLPNIMEDSAWSAAPQSSREAERQMLRVNHRQSKHTAGNIHRTQVNLEHLASF